MLYKFINVLSLHLSSLSSVMEQCLSIEQKNTGIPSLRTTYIQVDIASLLCSFMNYIPYVVFK